MTKLAAATGRLLIRVGALALLVVFLVAVPWVLWKVGGPYLPNHVPGPREVWDKITARDDGTLFLGFLVVVGYLAWAAFIIGLLTELAAAVTHRPAIRLPGLRPAQAVAGALIALLVAGTLTAHAPVAAAAAAGRTLPPLPRATATLAYTGHPHTLEPAARRVIGASPIPGKTHRANGSPGGHAGPTWTVLKGDTLWSIAERTLGDPMRYPEIVALNQGHPQPNGRALTDADWLDVGWHLLLPADAHIPGHPPTAGQSIVVAPGDTLSEIAQRTLGDADRYPELAATNHIADPDLIYPGQTIVIAAPTRADLTTDPTDHPHAAPETAKPTPSGHPIAAGTHPLVHEPTPPKHAAPQQDPAAPSEAPTPAVPTAAAASTGAPEPSGTPAVAAAPDTARATIDAPPGNTTAAGPTPILAASPAPQSGSVSDVDDPSAPARWVLGSMTIAAAGAAWAGLLAARRWARRHRQLGDRPVRPAPAVARTEKALRNGAAAREGVAVDTAVRLATNALDAEPAPISHAVIRGPIVELHLVRAAAPVEPFTGDPRSWILDTRHLTTPDGTHTWTGPLIASLGADGDATYLVNLENAGAINLTGDPTRCRQLLNHLAVELAHAPWADGIRLHLAGWAADLTPLNRDRIQPFDDITHQAKVVAHHADTVRRGLAGRTLTAARRDADDGTDWAAQILLIAPNTSGDGILPDCVSQLAQDLTAGPPAAAALITADDPSPIDGLAVTIDADGLLNLPDTLGGATIHAAGITDTELAGLLTLHSTVAETGDVAEDLGGSDGALTATELEGAQADLDPVPPDGGDVPVPVPLLTEPARPAVTESRDDLDKALQRWASGNTGEPRIAILGPPLLHATGVTPDRQTYKCTEATVYLALHPHGVTTDKLVTDLWPERQPPTAGGRRALVSRVRNWLGTDPDTGEPYLATVNGRPTLTRRLLDADLFTHLTRRARRQREDPAAALADYQRALALVRGPAFGGDTGAGYNWLANPDRLEDRTLPGLISDTAHAATRLAIDFGDVDAARTAAETGRLADPYNNTPLCDLLQLAHDAGDTDLAAQWLGAILHLNDADDLADLPDPARTAVSRLYPRGIPRT